MNEPVNVVLIYSSVELKKSFIMFDSIFYNQSLYVDIK